LYATRKEADGVEKMRGTLPRRAGDRMPASYVNLYIGSCVVVMPLLDRKHDASVAKTLAKLFPRRSIIGVEAREIVLGGGGIHCITQQVPIGVVTRGS
jgi:agmatine deiminase